MTDLILDFRTAHLFGIKVWTEGANALKEVITLKMRIKFKGVSVRCVISIIREY